MKEIENEIELTGEIVNESDDDISGLKIEINHNNNLLEEENSKLKPLRDKNLEILSKLQRLNLEFKNLELEEERAKQEKNKLALSKDVLEADIEREKNIILNVLLEDKKI